jgi:hypothetical protein
MLSLTPLLMHSDAVPTEARSALRAAYEAPPDHRTAELKTAARALYEGTDLECGEVLELVGLPEGACR